MKVRGQRKENKRIRNRKRISETVFVKVCRKYCVLKVAACIKAYLQKNTLERDKKFFGHSYAYCEKIV